MAKDVYGFIGGKSDVLERFFWNHLFMQQGSDEFFDFYRTDEKNLSLRLSEMFLHNRKGYIVAPELQGSVRPLLDRIDCGEKPVDTILNEGGVLTGLHLAEGDPTSPAWSGLRGTGWSDVIVRRYQAWTGEKPQDEALHAALLEVKNRFQRRAIDRLGSLQ